MAVLAGGKEPSGEELFFFDHLDYVALVVFLNDFVGVDTALNFGNILADEFAGAAFVVENSGEVCGNLLVFTIKEFAADEEVVVAVVVVVGNGYGVVIHGIALVLIVGEIDGGNAVVGHEFELFVAEVLVEEYAGVVA